MWSAFKFLVELAMVIYHTKEIVFILLGLGSFGVLLGGAEVLDLPTNLPSIGQHNIITCNALQEMKVTDTDMTFKVGSTSKINDLRYDPNTKHILVSASGEDGKQGVLCLEVPKDLLGTKIMVDVDDPNATYEVTDKGNVSLVKVQYNQ